MPAMILQINKPPKAGYFSHVFFTEDNRVVKLFLKKEGAAFTAEAPQNPDDNIVVSRAVWESECEAYELVTKMPTLVELIPRYFKREIIKDVIGKSGQSIASSYILDCAYSLEYIPGSDFKVNEYRGPLRDEITSAVERLRQAGVNYVHDASVIIDPNGSIFRLIDFGTWDAQMELSTELTFNLRLSDDMRAKWGSPKEDRRE